MNLLPEHWCVQNDGSDLFHKTVVMYLNTKYEQSYRGDSSRGYYGFDDKGYNNGSGAKMNKWEFAEDTILLTVEQFLACFTHADFPKVDPKYFYFTHGAGPVMVSVPKI